MTNLITEARELCADATPGPWECRNGTDDGGTPYNEVVAKCPCCGLIASCHPVAGDNDAAFIARSRTLIPELCDALEKAQEQKKQLVRELSALARESIEREKVLAKLEAEVMAACDSVRWIPVTERLPEDFAIVQIVEDNGYKWLPRIGEYRKNLDKWRAEGTFEHSNGWLEDTKMFKVTHWMPLPAPPEEGAEHE